ncbi:alkene reductase [Acidihalobacter aeolianus]|uniref:Alkene reductase n=1 Tax=Acidihalobacter aeolianus TaxID=2792603 RepID=A0A1D8K5Q0_9GAMM|nr:alkene reductase [Acidihalobacter aeolianus]AOV16275.1 alkene reductase [Acidihalobacter aeolianus]
MSDKNLLSPIKLGPYELPNRIAMAPMTRNRATNPEFAAGSIQATYYTQRAGAGLLISEGSQISPQAVGYPNTPGVYSPAQVAGWKQVTDAVHAAGGRIFCQLWHVGRISLPDFHDGKPPVAPSAVNPETTLYAPDGSQKPTVTPHALSLAEIRSTLDDYTHAARSALEAGFDGVEIHAANGYLLNQFLIDTSNQRTDEYGGSVEKRARIVFEVVEAVAGVWGADRVGIRLSPSGLFNIGAGSDNRSQFDYVIDRLNDHALAYLHLMEPFAPVDEIPNMIPHVAEHYRPRYRGTLIINNGFDQARGDAAIAQGLADMVAFGKPFISNPDLPARFAAGAPLAEYDQNTFYVGGEKGYIDYPAYSAA